MFCTKGGPLEFRLSGVIIWSDLKIKSNQITPSAGEKIKSNQITAAKISGQIKSNHDLIFPQPWHDVQAGSSNRAVGDGAVRGVPQRPARRAPRRGGRIGSKILIGTKDPIGTKELIGTKYPISTKDPIGTKDPIY